MAHTAFYAPSVVPLIYIPNPSDPRARPFVDQSTYYLIFRDPTDSFTDLILADEKGTYFGSVLLPTDCLLRNMVWDGLNLMVYCKRTPSIHPQGFTAITGTGYLNLVNDVQITL